MSLEYALSAADRALHNEVRALYSDHRDWLVGWLRRKLGGDDGVAADLAQDTFVSVIESGSAPAIQTPRPFLATLAKRLMIQRHRRQLLEHAYLDLLAALPEELAPSPEAHCLALEALRQVDQALSDLPAKVKEAFLLAHLDELSYAQIAERLDVSASSVKQYLTRANRHCLFALSA